MAPRHSVTIDANRQGNIYNTLNKIGLQSTASPQVAGAEDVLQLLKVAVKIFNKRSKQPTTGGLPG